MCHRVYWYGMRDQGMVETTYLDQDTFTIQSSPLKKNKNKINVGIQDEAFASLDI